MGKLERFMGGGILAAFYTYLAGVVGWYIGGGDFVPREAYLSDLNLDGRQDIVCEYDYEGGRSIFLQQEEGDKISYVNLNNYLDILRAADSMSAENVRDSLYARTDSIREQILRRARDTTQQ